MSNQHHSSSRERPIWPMLALCVVLPASLSAQPQIEAPDDVQASLSDSPFDDFAPLDGYEHVDTAASPGVDPTELDEAQRADEDIATPPDTAVALRFDFDRTNTYQVRNSLRIDYDDRSHIASAYQSGHYVEYYPIDEQRRDELDYWPIDVDTDGDIDLGDTTTMRVSIGNTSNIFEQPDPLSSRTDAYSLLRQATITFRITDRGAIGDVRVHPPTNPLMRSSIEELIRLLAASHPPLPEEYISPGDSWTDTVEWSADSDDARLSQEATLTYTFERWATCDGDYCAVIDIDQDIEARGSYYAGTLETGTVSTGAGVGRILFDVQEGRVVDSQYNVTARGATQTVREDDDDGEPVNDFSFGLHVNSTATLH